MSDGLYNGDIKIANLHLLFHKSNRNSWDRRKIVDEHLLGILVAQSIWFEFVHVVRLISARGIGSNGVVQTVSILFPIRLPWLGIPIRVLDIP
jgi:hypothetical protein